MWLCSFQARSAHCTVGTYLGLIQHLSSRLCHVVWECVVPSAEHINCCLELLSHWHAAREIHSSKHCEILGELISATSLSVTASGWSQRLHGLNSEATKSNYLNESWISILWSQDASCKALHWQDGSARLYNWHPHKLFVFVWVALERSEVLSYPWKYRWNSKGACCWMSRWTQEAKGTQNLTINKKRASGKTIFVLFKEKKF